MKLNIIHNERCEKTLQQLPDNFLDLTVTSPPYDNLRKYDGFDFDLDVIIPQLLRVTKIGGVCVWVVADQTINFSETGSSFRQALQFMESGWCLYDTIIWEKTNYMPSGNPRYADAFEFMFVFSKGKPKSVNLIKVPCVRKGQNQSWASRPHESKVWKENGNQIRKTLDEKTKGNIWKYSTGKGGSTSDVLAFEHPAIFPEKLVRDHIYSWSNEGDLVYDPFSGSATTAKVAMKMNRNYLGSEISEKYWLLGNERLAKHSTDLFSKAI